MPDEGRIVAPVTEFAASTGLFAELLDAEKTRAVRDGCGSTLLHHGRATDRVLVLFHGYTNCPRQLEGVARLAHGAGLTVFSPLAPAHGRADLDPSELQHLGPREIEAFIRGSIALASGLGRSVSVLGFSFGGVCAAWAARHLDEVTDALILSPSFAPRGTPLWALPMLPVWSRALPERHLWWDPVRKDGYLGSPYSYRRFSRRGIGSVFEVGLDVARKAASRTTKLDNAVLVLNATDVAISPSAARWAFRRGIAPVARHSSVYRFSAKDRFPHDMVDPNGMSGERAVEVWPVLLGLMGVETNVTLSDTNEMWTSLNGGLSDGRRG